MPNSDKSDRDTLLESDYYEIVMMSFKAIDGRIQEGFWSPPQDHRILIAILQITICLL